MEYDVHSYEYAEQPQGTVERVLAELDAITQLIEAGGSSEEMARSISKCVDGWCEDISPVSVQAECTPWDSEHITTALVLMLRTMAGVVKEVQSNYTQLQREHELLCSQQKVSETTTSNPKSKFKSGLFGKASEKVTTQSTPKQSTLKQGTEAPIEGTTTAPSVQATVKAPKETNPSATLGTFSKKQPKVANPKPTHNVVKEEAPSGRRESSPSSQAVVNNGVHAPMHGRVEGSTIDWNCATHTVTQGDESNKQADEGNGGEDATGWNNTNVVDGDGWDNAHWDGDGWNNEDAWDGAQDDANGWNNEDCWDGAETKWDGDDAVVNDEVGMGVPTSTHPPTPVVAPACTPKVMTRAPLVPPQVPKNAISKACDEHPQQTLQQPSADIEWYVYLRSVVLQFLMGSSSERLRLTPLMQAVMKRDISDGRGTNRKYLKNVVGEFISTDCNVVRGRLIQVMATLMQLTPAELEDVYAWNPGWRPEAPPAGRSLLGNARGWAQRFARRPVRRA